MHVLGCATAALLLAFFAGQGAIPAAHAASAKSACARAEQHGKRCFAARRVASPRREGSQRAMPRAALARPPRWAGLGWLPRGRHHFSGDAAGISQLSPRLRPRGASKLRFDREDRNPCGGNGDRARPRAPCRSNLADALLQPPDATTQQILRETGIPVIPDVPPIAILRSGTERHPAGLFEAGSP